MLFFHYGIPLPDPKYKTWNLNQKTLVDITKILPLDFFYRPTPPNMCFLSCVELQEKYTLIEYVLGKAI